MSFPSRSIGVASKRLVSPVALLWFGLGIMVCVGVLGRGYWTPDEPREADIAWRMSWQAEKSVPQLAGDAFCEKPPLTYWLAAVPIKAFGPAGWAARLPNLLYALITALSVLALGRRSAGTLAGVVAAAAITTFLLAYQVAIWLATDAPLLAAVSAALLGTYIGFYASDGRERLGGYTLMHAALAMGFLSKSAVAWMVPSLALVTLAAWEGRWRELLRWELYAGIALEAAVILTWIACVYVGPDGLEHLKVFFWNNLVGRFARIDAPQELAYASAHRNSPGKYLLEMPLYLWPWTLLVIAAARRAWQRRHASPEALRTVRFAVAASLPGLAVLSIAATARNIYFAPALPGVALLVGWWAREAAANPDPWDLRALSGTAVLLFMAVIAAGAAVALVGFDSWHAIDSPLTFVAISASGLALGGAGAVHARFAARRRQPLRAGYALAFGYCALMIAPASQIYARVDAWQDLAAIGGAMARDAAGHRLIVFAPDETTRALIDLYVRNSVDLVPGPVNAASLDRLTSMLAQDPNSVIAVQLPGREAGRVLQAVADHFKNPGAEAQPAWISRAHLRAAHRYSLPNGRRYALLAWQRAPVTPSP